MVLDVKLGKKQEGKFRKIKKEKRPQKQGEKSGKQAEKPTLEKDQCVYCKNTRHWKSSCPKLKERERHSRVDPVMAVEEDSD